MSRCARCAIASSHPDVNSPHKSRWSKESTSDIVFASPSLGQQSSYGAPWNTYSSCGATWDIESPISSDSEYDQDHFGMELFDRSSTPSSAQTAQTSMPTTPEHFDTTFGARLHKPDLRGGLMINTNLPRPRIYDAGSSLSSYSPGTSIMHTAIEYDPHSSMFFVSSPLSANGVIVMPDSAITAVGEDKEMTSPSMWTPSSTTQMSAVSIYSDPSTISSFASEDNFTRSRTPSPEPAYYDALLAQAPLPQQCQLSSSVSTATSDTHPDSRLTPTVCPQHRRGTAPAPAGAAPAAGKPSPLGRFAVKFFPRAPSPAPAPPAPAAAAAARRAAAREPHPPAARGEAPPAPPRAAAGRASEVGRGGARGDAALWRGAARAAPPAQHPQLRSARHWFLPGRHRLSADVN